MTDNERREALIRELGLLEISEDHALEISDDVHLESISQKRRDIKREIAAIDNKENEKTEVSEDNAEVIKQDQLSDELKLKLKQNCNGKLAEYIASAVLLAVVVGLGIPLGKHVATISIVVIILIILIMITAAWFITDLILKYKKGNFEYRYADVVSRETDSGSYVTYTFRVRDKEMKESMTFCSKADLKEILNTNKAHVFSCGNIILSELDLPDYDLE